MFFKESYFHFEVYFKFSIFQEFCLYFSHIIYWHKLCAVSFKKTKKCYFNLKFDNGILNEIRRSKVAAQYAHRSIGLI